ncbi:hypothetical protein DJ017_16120 [Phenylobacterium soli]|uniref:Uncharacterized protein n=1 Tax=Phenylobacterium soli TaxID=2170551 RepID=A0A328ANK2_9CAUL|nr:hypothetical protein DJ017_16120 [Phenylobacterium soli]
MTRAACATPYESQALGVLMLELHATGTRDARRRLRLKNAGLAISVGLAGAIAGLAVPAQAAPKAEQAAPDGAAALRIARSFRAAGDARSAVPVYRTLLARRPNDAAVQVELADALLDTDMIDDAIGLYTAVDPASPSGGDAELGLARAQLKLNRADRALAHMDRAVQLAPTNVRVLVGRGVVLDRLGRHADAQASYRKALSREPRSVAARTDLALSLALSGQYDQALEILEPIARSAGASAQDRQNLAFVYGLKGDKADALAMSRVDLDESQAQANAKFFDYARAQPR